MPAYGPPPAAHGYGPPPPVHSPPPPVDRRLERGRKVQRFLRFVVLIGVACAVVWGVVYFGFIWNGRPEKGDCLSSLTEEFEGFPIVACDDPSAAYEIVTYVTGGKYDTDLGACDDYPNGEVVKGGGGRKSTSRWEFCAVPLK
ncbi:MAG TPA: hypothetical protein VGF17_10840 [Phytomonospora sp.]